MRRLLGGTLFAALMLSLAVACCAQTTPAVELHGYAQNRFYSNPSMSARFVTERVSLSAVGKLSDNVTGYLEVYFHPWITDDLLGGTTTTPLPAIPAGGQPATTLTGTTTGFTAEQSRVYLESAYVDMPLGPGKIRIGKGRQLNFGMTPSYPNRKISNYGILAEVFTQDRIMGFQWSAKSGTLDGGVSFFTDQNIGTRGIGDCAGATAADVVKHIADRDDPANISGRMAGSARFGITNPVWNLHVSACTGGLNPAQLGALAPFVPAGTVNTNTDHNKYGVDAAWASGPFVIQGEWYTGKFSLLGISGYQVLVGWQPKDKPRYAVRWAALNNDKGVTANPLTWNTQQLTVGYVYPIRKGVWIEVNYEKNMSSNPAGTTAPDNDILFTEFFTGF